MKQIRALVSPPHMVMEPVVLALPLDGSRLFHCQIVVMVGSKASRRVSKVHPASDAIQKRVYVKLHTFTIIFHQAIAVHSILSTQSSLFS